jgi:hypothetical protein
VKDTVIYSWAGWRISIISAKDDPETHDHYADWIDQRIVIEYVAETPHVGIKVILPFSPSDLKWASGELRKLAESDAP